MLEKTLESSLDWKEIQAVNPKGNQPWIFFGRTDAEAEASILLPPDVKNQLIGKDLDAGKDWRQKENGAAEMKWLDSITTSMDMNLSKFWDIVQEREPGMMRFKGFGVTYWVNSTNNMSMQSWEEVGPCEPGYDVHDNPKLWRDVFSVGPLSLTLTCQK